MTDAILLLGPEHGGADALSSLAARRVQTRAEVKEAIAGGAEYLWIARSAGDLGPLLRAAGTCRCASRVLKGQRVLVLAPLTAAQRMVCSELFGRVVAPAGELRLLAEAELAEVLAAPDAADYLVAVAVDAGSGLVLLYRGNLDALVVPFSWFEVPGGGTPPDFSDFGVADYGQTVRFGAYEAAASAILYDFDAAYRKRAKERARGLDRSIGGSVRRLRVLRGLRQSDFPGISTKEIGRIERGDIQNPHASTLAVIASRLGVSVDELRSY